jgi:molecular chaperone DnaK
MRRPDGASSRIVLVGTATYGADASLPDLPSVRNNLTDLVSTLSQSAHGWFRPEHCEVVTDPATAEDVVHHLTRIAPQAEDLLLVYYAGHGLLDSRGNLYLGLSKTRRNLLRYTAMPFDGVREIVGESPARNRVVFLDCCFSGRAIDVMAPDDVVMDQTQITGSYTLTATASGVTALAPSGERNTAFTGELLRLLQEGDPRAPENLTLDHVYRSLYRGLLSRGLPEPRRQGTDTVEDLVLAQNLGYRPVSGDAASGRLLVDDAEQLGYGGDPVGAADRYTEIHGLLTMLYGADSANVRSAWASVNFWSQQAPRNTTAPPTPGGRAVGIDFGSTNSVISVLEDGKPTVVPNAEGARTTPSVVAFAENGHLLVGEAAKRQMVTNADRTIHTVKQHLGTDWSITLDGTEYSPQRMAAFILRKLKRDAEAYLGEPVTDAVLTVPARFDDAQRQALREAGEIAGLNVLRLVHDPTAAAFVYGLDKDADQRVVLVFSLGGSTFDVSVLEIDDGVVEVKATSGDNHLGGKDWDQCITDHLVRQFRTSHGVDLSQDMMAMQRLREASEKAKIELSSALETTISLPYIHGHLFLEETLTRVQFEWMTNDLLQRCEMLFRTVLRDAEIDASHIDHVIVVGGATRMPAVTALINGLTGGKRTRRSTNSNEIFAVGAARQAGVLKGEVTNVLVLETNPQSLGIETQGGIMAKLIERNTTLPTKHSEIFTTAEDNQQSLKITVYRGEHEVAAENERVGTFELTELIPAERGIPQIEVTFEIDSDNVVHVSAQDMTSGKVQRVRRL